MSCKENLEEVLLCNLKRKDRDRIKENPQARKLCRKKEKKLPSVPMAQEIVVRKVYVRH